MEKTFTEDGILYAKSTDGKAITVIQCKDKNRKTIIIKEGVTCIREQAFVLCEMETLILPDSLEIIQRDAFYACQSLKTVHFGNHLKEIEISAFSMCKSLKSVVLPDSLLKVEYGAFDSIQEVTCQRYIDGLVESFADGLFEDLPYTVVMNIGDFRMLMPRNITVSEDFLKRMFNKEEICKDKDVSAYKENIFRYDGFGNGNCLVSAVEIFLDNPQNETAKKFIYEKEKAVVIQFLEKRYRPDIVIKLMTYCEFSDQTLTKFLEIAQEKTDIPFAAYVMQQLQKQKNSPVLKI